MTEPTKALPELLAPAGSPLALDAALESGADAVYLGATAFNARINAHNFTKEDLRAGVRRAHAFGAKVYLALNTLVYQREMGDFLRAAASAQEAGVDALIEADLGGAAVIHKYLPDLALHASTQVSGHNAAMAAELQKLGFTRMVCARELSLADLHLLVANSPLEIEIFVHGALCVCHSGQCLFSSMVGGRSGNRGECAQPCRLPYAGKTPYPLSLKDLSLAAHVPKLLAAGVASLKIEGRMKSPEYVRDVVRIWRRLLDERRAATPAEMQQLADIFSRGGLTDGYFTGRIQSGMLGVRSETDKQNSKAEPFTKLTRKIPLSLVATIRTGLPATLSISDGKRRICVTGQVPAAAINAPLHEDVVRRNLSKFGGTLYEVADLSISLDDGLMMPVSHLNALRRAALEAWENTGNSSNISSLSIPVDYKSEIPVGNREVIQTARFCRSEQITPSARQYFKRLYLPLPHYTAAADGVVLPAVILDSETDKVHALLQKAYAAGARHALVGNYGHLSLVEEVGMTAHGDFRLNVTNPDAVCTAERRGLRDVILSPELSLPQARDIGGNTGVIVYGRLPLMVLEKCVIREIADCKTCASGQARLTDRRGVSFPVLREYEHRNLIYNSLPTYMADRADALDRAGILNRHFLFSTESPSQVDKVIAAYRAHALPNAPVRRI